MRKHYTEGFDAGKAPNHGVMPTGLPTIDEHLMTDLHGKPRGGIPRGGFYEVSGGTQTGKSRLCYMIMAQEQRLGNRVGLGDAENRMVLDGGVDYIRSYGVQFDEEHFLYVGPDDTGHFILEDVFRAIREIAIGELATLFVIDSVAALQPLAISQFVDDEKKNKDGRFQSGQSGTVATAQLSALREVVPICVMHGLTVLLINHRRLNPDPFGKPDYSPGGTAKGHLLNAALCLRRPELDPKTRDITVQVHVEKDNIGCSSGVKTGEKQFGDIPPLVLPGPITARKLLGIEELPDDPDPK